MSGLAGAKVILRRERRGDQRAGWIADAAGGGDGTCGLGGNDTFRGTLDRFIRHFVCARLVPAQMLR